MRWRVFKRQKPCSGTRAETPSVHEEAEGCPEDTDDDFQMVKIPDECVERDDEMVLFRKRLWVGVAFINMTNSGIYIQNVL